VDNDKRGYKSGPEGQDAEHVRDDRGEEVSGAALVEYSGNEENLLKTERGSEEVGSYPQSGARCKTDDGNTEAAPLLSTSSKAAAHMSDGSKDKQSEKCPICLARIITRVVATTDICNHTFCVDCLQEWSKRANTCPVDRQTFNFILVRHHLKKEIVRIIPVEPSAQESDDGYYDVED
jgi:hypothetical protein